MSGSGVLQITFFVILKLKSRSNKDAHYHRDRDRTSRTNSSACFDDDDYYCWWKRKEQKKKKKRRSSAAQLARNSKPTVFVSCSLDRVVSAWTELNWVGSVELSCRGEWHTLDGISRKREAFCRLLLLLLLLMQLATEWVIDNQTTGDRGWP